MHLKSECVKNGFCLKNQTSWSKLVRPWFLHTGIIKCRTTDDVTLTLVNDLRSGIWHTVRSRACTCNLSISFLSKLLHVIWQKRRRADWWTDWRGIYRRTIILSCPPIITLCICLFRTSCYFEILKKVA